MPRRITESDYITLAEENNFTWVGNVLPRRTHDKTRWQCREGHHWQASYHNIKHNGSGCPYCRGTAPKVAKDYRALARNRKFVWIGPEVATTTSKTGWRCRNNHTWLASFSHIQAGRGCPHCAGKAPKTHRNYIQLADQRGFVWLGPMVSRVSVKTGWECAHGHRWQASFNSISNGSGCPHCANNFPKTERDYHALADQHGFQWLGPKVQNALTPTAWLCANEHIWWARYNDLQQGLRCGHCHRANLD
ncbi:MAG: hypothetical protein H6656_00685 [Ardenticatenaceae bacterium]|nr:hypothetical protein [Anaerolineales bacterium]MCB9005900.1 hypothetical protein [Ardenticatenaceae bacterium]